MKNGVVFVGNLLKSARQSVDSLFLDTFFLTYQHGTEVVTWRIFTKRQDGTIQRPKGAS